MAGISQQACQSIAKHSPPRMAHMQRAGGVGRDIFHVHLLPGPHGRAPIIRAFLQHRRQHTLPNDRRKTQVQESRPGHLGAGDARIIGQFSGQHVSNITRLHLGRFRQHHRRVRRHIAMRRIARRFHGDVIKAQPLGQRAFGLHLRQRVQYQAADLGKQVHYGCPFACPAVYHANQQGQWMPKVCSWFKRIPH